MGIDNIPDTRIRMLKCLNWLIKWAGKNNWKKKCNPHWSWKKSVFANPDHGENTLTADFMKKNVGCLPWLEYQPQV